MLKKPSKAVEAQDQYNSDPPLHQQSLEASNTNRIRQELAQEDKSKIVSPTVEKLISEEYLRRGEVLSILGLQEIPKNFAKAVGAFQNDKGQWHFPKSAVLEMAEQRATEKKLEVLGRRGIAFLINASQSSIDLHIEAGRLVMDPVKPSRALPHSLIELTAKYYPKCLDVVLTALVEAGAISTKTKMEALAAQESDGNVFDKDKYYTASQSETYIKKLGTIYRKDWQEKAREDGAIKFQRQWYFPKEAVDAANEAARLPQPLTSPPPCRFYGLAQILDVPKSALYTPEKRQFLLHNAEVVSHSESRNVYKLDPEVVLDFTTRFYPNRRERVIEALVEHEPKYAKLLNKQRADMSRNANDSTIATAASQAKWALPSASLTKDLREALGIATSSTYDSEIMGALKIGGFTVNNVAKILSCDENQLTQAIARGQLSVDRSGLLNPEAVLGFVSKSMPAKIGTLQSAICDSLLLKGSPCIAQVLIDFKKSLEKTKDVHHAEKIIAASLAGIDPEILPDSTISHYVSYLSLRQRQLLADKTKIEARSLLIVERLMLEDALSCRRARADFSEQ